MSRWARRLALILLLLGAVGLLVYAFLPKPIHVDLAAAERGPMEVTVNEDGKTRIKEHYIVSAPLAGTMERITLRAGDPVEAGKTLLTSIAPTPPALLDARAIAQAEARVEAAQAALERTEPLLESARAAMELAESEQQRARRLYASESISVQQFEEAESDYRMRAAQFRAARLAEDIARFELQQARAALLRTKPGDDDNGSEENSQFEIRAPIGGRVLRVIQESTTVVTPGTALIELGDPRNLEVVVDVLSSDAVKIHPADRVLFEQWGGKEPLEGAVRLVEPAGFTKISALGVEEQRVNVVIDFISAPERWLPLGDGYRVEARIIIWQRADVLKVPARALFRHGNAWAVYVAGDGRARLRELSIGEQNGLEAQVLKGLEPGERVIVDQSDEITNGRRVIAR